MRWVDCSPFLEKAKSLDPLHSYYSALLSDFYFYVFFSYPHLSICSMPLQQSNGANMELESVSSSSGSLLDGRYDLDKPALYSES